MNSNGRQTIIYEYAYTATTTVYSVGPKNIKHTLWVKQTISYTIVQPRVSFSYYVDVIIIHNEL